ncbi:TIGR02588 family protein [Pararhizobium sp. PWRC1-1]|uniref:TIGR02588 family protein n=1 Tax=Pararhizobium sp. PWRC1-1 TaxID=2804566 RepID=UPI003CEBDEEB
MPEATKDTASSRRVKRGAHWIEWAVGGLCTLLVAALILWIAYHAVINSAGVPELDVKVTHQQANAGGSYTVSFVVSNKGTRTAAAVPVTGTLKDGERIIETQEITFDYVPAQSTATGTLLFKADPAAYQLDIHASGYVDP